MAAFARYWRMTPAEIYELSNEEYNAFVDFMKRDAEEADRQARRAKSMPRRR